MIGLAPFLAALRQAGLPVGVAEVARLREVFAREPRLADDPGASTSPRLRAVLRAVCVKSVEDRALFESLFDAWLSRSEQDLRALTTSQDEVKAREVPRQSRRVFGRTLTPSLLLLLCLSLGGHLKVPPPGGGSPAPTVQPIPPDQPKAQSVARRTFNAVRPAGTLAEIHSRLFTTWVPAISVMPDRLARPVWQSRLPLALGGLALTTAGGLWLALRKRPWFPKAAPEPVKKGPPRVFLAPPRLAGPQLLEAREEEALVWGIGHFVAEAPTRRLDLPATVRATARAAGLPHLRFHQARYPREVWLWVDEAADDPAIERIAGEVEAALLAHGLPVERALFRGLPDWLVNAAGQVFAPNEVDERRDAALVAILTDGRILARQLAADDRRVYVDAFLRSLSHWPRLAFVDFTTGPSELAALLPKHSLARITPMELAAFLGVGEAPQRRTAAGAAGDSVWAAACAIAPSSVDEPRAFELRRRLGLAVSPWALRALRTEAPGPPGRLQWQAADRARRVNWLRTAEAQKENDLANGSLLGRAHAYWLDIYDKELDNRTKGELGLSAEGTPAYQHLLMERALLRLWRHDSTPAAVRELYRLHSGTLRETVERLLGSLAPLDFGGEEDVHLPWHWSDLSGPEQVMLQEMRLGGGMPVATLRRSGRLWIGLGLCLGLAGGVLSATFFNRPNSPSEPPRIENEAPPRGTAHWLSQTSAGSWQVLAGSSKSFARQNATAGAVARVHWTHAQRRCVEEPVPGVEAWYCGTRPVSEFSQLSPDIGQSVVILEEPEKDPAVETLAIALLDSGSADIVYVVRASPFEWWKRIDSIIPLREDQQMLVLSTSFRRPSVKRGGRVGWLRVASWKGLEAALRFADRKPAGEVWPGLEALAGNPAQMWLHGLDCRMGETIEEAGMAFVHICRGKFMMGSRANDAKASSDEMPIHEVALSEYWIAKDEVTRAQYDGKGADSHPATAVTWFDAKSFCEQHGWRLPTEAEWENAARAGTRTEWSFGDDEKALGDFAWFERNSSLESHPVGTRKPNLWGVRDMYGNVWEWVEDWYGPYEAKPQTDPMGFSGSEQSERVLRGGAADFTPKYLRSAFRYKSGPSFRNKYIGFRCAVGAGR